jgi:NADH:ubiquinone oxidoreductase subunit F (NADH-binding)
MEPERIFRRGYAQNSCEAECDPKAKAAFTAKKGYLAPSAVNNVETLFA